MKVKELMELLSSENPNADLKIMLYSEDGAAINEVLDLEEITKIADGHIVNLIGTERKPICVP